MRSNRKTTNQSEHYDFAEPLLRWYDTQARRLPWRKYWPELAHPYDVFLSELMLQQTVVATVIPYFLRFKSLWPTIHDLAACEEAELMKEWAGLGYYARARNLHKAAKIIVEEYDGVFPDTEEALLALPGIGPYTAAALTSFAFDKPAIVLDGNIERVLSRYLGDKTALPALKANLRKIYPHIQPERRHSDFPQAMMDLGAMICIPKMPRCSKCPVADGCQMAGKEEAALLPVKPPKKAKPKRVGHIFVAEKEGKALMYRRKGQGLLGGMMLFPTTDWIDGGGKEMPAFVPPLTGDWQEASRPIRHIFTHFELELRVFKMTLAAHHHWPDAYQLCTPEEVGLATVMKKAWQVQS